MNRKCTQTLLSIIIVLTQKDSKGLTKELVSQVSASLRKIGCTCMVCVKNVLKRSVPFVSTVRSVSFRSVLLRSPFRFDGLLLPAFLATDADLINFTKNLAIPCPVALIPSCRNFRDISPGLRPWWWWYITTCFV